MEDKILDLKHELESFGTRELLGMIAIKFITFSNGPEDIAQTSDIFNKTELTSPLKQYAYLAGLLMSTTDNSRGRANDDPDKYKKLEDKVQEITHTYISNFFDIEKPYEKALQEKFKNNFVAMEAFISYFDMDVLRYEEQTEALIKNLYTPFSTELVELTGLEIEDFLSFYHFVEEQFKNSMTRPKSVMESVESFLSSFTPNPDNIESEYQRLLSGDNGRLAQEIQESMDGLYTIKKEQIIEFYGQKKGNLLLKYFSLERKNRDFMYYNESNPFSKSPLCWLDDNYLFIVHPKFLMTAIYNFITDVLEKPTNIFSDKYKAKKSDIVENLFVDLLKKIFGVEAIFHTSVCEEKGTKEHDILIEFKDIIFIAEVKASKVREPFFNPEKAFVRIRDHFNSDSGIGGAYKQAIILKRFIEKHEKVVLYEEKTNAFSIENINTKKIIPLVLTLNQFGSIAINTSELLEKDENDPYPWVCNLHDLEDILAINNYLNKNVTNFIEYIQWRIKNHYSISASDEIDVFEEYCLNENIRISKGKKLFFWPTGPSIIDKIYYEKHGISYLHPVLDKGKSVQKKKVGRNDPCPCGSGKKFKKCCGRI